MSQVYDFTNNSFHRAACEQGATFSRVLTCKDENGRVINLTGYTAAMKVRPTADSSTVIVSLTNGSGTSISGSAGQITLSISASATAALTAGDYVYDLELTNGSEVQRLIEGKFQISAEVTR